MAAEFGENKRVSELTRTHLFGFAPVTVLILTLELNVHVEATCCMPDGFPHPQALHFQHLLPTIEDC